MAFTVLNSNVTVNVQHAIRTSSERENPAQETWAYMEQTYNPRDCGRQIALQQELTFFAMLPGERAPDYLNRANALRSQLKSVNYELDEQKFCLHIIQGLTAEWDSVRDRLEQEDDLTEKAVSKMLMSKQNTWDTKSRQDALFRSHTRTIGNFHAQPTRAPTPHEVDIRPTSPGLNGRRPSRTTSWKRKQQPTASTNRCYCCKEPGHGWLACRRRTPNWKSSLSDKETARQSTNPPSRGPKGSRGGDSSNGGSTSTMGSSNVPRHMGHATRVPRCTLRPEVKDHKDSGTWLLDSGCSAHMSFEKDAFQSLRPLREPVEILVGNNEKIPAMGEGDVPLDTEHGSIMLRNVLYAPHLAANLISYTCLMKRRCVINNSTTGVTICATDGGEVFTADEWQGMLRANVKSHRFPLVEEFNDDTSKTREEPETRRSLRLKEDSTGSLVKTNPNPPRALMIKTGTNNPSMRHELARGHKSLIKDGPRTQGVARQRMRERIDNEATMAVGAINAPPTQVAVHGTAQSEFDDRAQDLAQEEQAVQDPAQEVQVVQDPVQTEQAVPDSAHDEQIDEDPAYDERAVEEPVEDTQDDAPRHETQASVPKQQDDGGD